MNPNLSITTEIAINAAPAEIWDALINPVKIKKYLFGTNASSDWKKGAKLYFRGEYNGTHYEDHGEILEIEPNRILSYSYFSNMSGMDDKPENYSTVTFKIKEGGNNPVLQLTQKGAKDEASIEHSAQNWKMVLEKIKEVAETK